VCNAGCVPVRAALTKCVSFHPLPAADRGRSSISSCSSILISLRNPPPCIPSYANCVISSTSRLTVSPLETPAVVTLPIREHDRAIHAILRLFMISLSRICSRSQTFSVINLVDDPIRRLIGRIIITYRYDTDKDDGSFCASASIFGRSRLRVSQIKTNRCRRIERGALFHVAQTSLLIIPRNSPSIPPSLIPSVAFIVAVIELCRLDSRKLDIALAAMRACALLALISDY